MGAYRLGIDVGSNSIGWCILDLDSGGEPCSVRDVGVRVFASGRDPQSDTSLAVERRRARGMRRRRDRFLRRRDDLMAALVRHGLMPADEQARKALEARDPYELRARGLDEVLALHELGRALFHLHQRRGFKSNRKSDRGDKETGPIKEGIAKLRSAMVEADARTYGEFLWMRHRDRRPVRARNVGGAKAAYDFYPDRALTEEEFDRLWAAQAAHHPSLSPDAEADIRKIFFRQRPLRPINPGKCTLRPEEQRAPVALPSSQRIRIHQDLGNLRICRPGMRERPLTLAERDKLLGRLLGAGASTFKSLAKALKLPPDAYFNLESERRDKLKGDETAAVLAHKERFGKGWRDLSFDRQQQIVEKLLDAEDEDALVAWLMEDCGLEEAAAQKVSDAALPAGYQRLGRSVSLDLLSVYETGATEAADPDTGEVYETPLTYDKAVKVVAPHHSDLDRRDDLLDRLPYYGDALARHVVENHDAPAGSQERRGRITNPTVHIGLNQLRMLVNSLIETHGRPAQIVVELARELKMSKEEKDNIARLQKRNQDANEKRAEKMKVEAEITEPTGRDFLRMRLWEELDPEDAANRRCPYTGEQIGVRRLFRGDVEIEHILPYGETLDNSPANLTVSTRAANRDKGRRSPWEAFHASPGAYDWAAITERASRLPRNKRWRFQPDAMDKFRMEEGFLDRQLVDTQYLAGIAKTYLGLICPIGDVWVIPGRLTAMLRGKWGLNGLLPDHNYANTGQEKNRTDHRHHAIDAFVVACTSRALLQRIAGAADRARERLIDDMPLPWQGFDRNNLQEAVNGIVVSHRADHGVRGKLHEETAFGAVADPAAWDGNNLVHRKPFVDLNPREAERIRDPLLRDDLRDWLFERGRDGVSHKDAMAEFAKAKGIRRVRLLKKEKDVIAVRGDDGRAYKFYSPGDNHRVEVFEMPDGSWKGEGVTVFDANRSDFVPRWRSAHPAARLVMRVHKGDLLALRHDGRDRVMVVRQLDASASRFKLAAHNETGNLQERHSRSDDPFRWLMASYNTLRKAGARKVRVDPLGRVWNMAPPE